MQNKPSGGPQEQSATPEPGPAKQNQPQPEQKNSGGGVKDLVQDAAKGFGQDLMNGKDPLESAMNLVKNFGEDLLKQGQEKTSSMGALKPSSPGGLEGADKALSESNANEKGAGKQGPSMTMNKDKEDEKGEGFSLKSLAKEFANAAKGVLSGGGAAGPAQDNPAEEQKTKAKQK